MNDPTQTSPGAPEPLWNVNQVAEYFGCSASAIYKWVERGPKRGASYGPALPCVRLGALVRFVPSKVLAWAEGASHEPASAPVLQLKRHTQAP